MHDVDTHKPWPPSQPVLILLLFLPTYTLFKCVDCLTIANNIYVYDCIFHTTTKSPKPY